VLEITIQIYDNWYKFSETSFQIRKNEKKVVFIQFDFTKIPINNSLGSSFTLLTNDPRQKRINIPITVFVKPKELIITLQIGNLMAYVQQPGEMKKESIRLDTPPTIVNGRTVVPLRFLAETFGAKVTWLQAEEEIQIRYEGILIHLWLHRNYRRTYDALIERTNQALKKIALDTPPCIINARTMVPLRFIAEIFGAEVEWDSKTQTITLRKRKE
jgi:hypothetical protein